MALIDKAALVAKIEKRFDEYSSSILRHYDACTEARASELGKILVFLNTLEVKEMDLEKHLKEDIEDVFFDLNGVAVKGATHCLTVEDVKDIAKHFYELGMAASNKAQKGEEA